MFLGCYLGEWPLSRRTQVRPVLGLNKVPTHTESQHCTLLFLVVVVVIVVVIVVVASA